MARKRYNLIIYSFIILYIFLYRFVFFNNFLKYNESITAVFSILLLSLSVLLLGYRKISNNYINKKVFNTVLISIFLYFVTIYGIGLFTGFLENSYSLTIGGIFNNIIFILISIISIELFRYVFIRANKDNMKSVRFITFLLILFESNLLIRMDSFNGIQNIFTYFSVSFLPALMKNVMCSYLTYMTNYKSSLLYCIIMELYVYLVPIEPDFNDYMRSVSTLVLPFVILMLSSRICGYDVTEAKEINFKGMTRKTDIPFIIMLLLFACLVLGIGPLKIVGIETGSMQPSLNVGDAVIINKSCDRESLKEDDIVAYTNKDGELIIHRIIKVNKDKTFITKGDYNNASDSFYVNKDQIYGKVVIRIPFIAYPAIKFRQK